MTNLLRNDNGPLRNGFALKNNYISAFQPGSTPNYNADRFLCWNRVGIVKGIIDTKKEKFQPIRGQQTVCVPSGDF